MGDILIEDGTSTPLEITCVITDKDLIRNISNISSKLYFKKDNSNVTDDKVMIQLLDLLAFRDILMIFYII